MVLRRFKHICCTLYSYYYINSTSHHQALEEVWDSRWDWWSCGQGWEMSWDQQEPEAFADGQVKGFSAVAVIQDQGRLALGKGPGVLANSHHFLPSFLIKAGKIQVVFFFFLIKVVGKELWLQQRNAATVKIIPSQGGGVVTHPFSLLLPVPSLGWPQLEARGWGARRMKSSVWPPGHRESQRKGENGPGGTESPCHLLLKSQSLCSTSLRFL